MENLLTFLILYIIAVFLYAIVTKNDAMNKYNPYVKVTSFLKEGMIGIGVGFLAVGVLCWILQQIVTWVHLSKLSMV